MGWVGVDLDGTLAKHPITDPWRIGEPVPAMVDRVKAWRAKGIEVRILTARAMLMPGVELGDIQAWCRKHIGEALPITCSKDFDMIALFDDRAVQVERDTGRIPAGQETYGLD